ncbi:phage tail tape measure protein, partial [Candidatus Darwinibacter acetoxidans]
GNEKYRKSLQALGISLEDLDKGLVGTEEAFIAMIDYLHQMEDSQQQAAVAGDFFGVMLARRMMPLIRDGAESVEELRQRAHELGLVMDDLAIAKGDLLSDTLDDLSFTAKGLGRIFGSELHAPMINISRAITDVISRFSTWLTENPKVVRQIIVWGGAIAGVLGALTALGTTMIVTGKIIGALGTIFNILTSKPMLIIAAIGALYLAWESDWLGIRTAMENAWEVIEPILETLWSWLGEAWNWAINIAGNAWEWLTQTTWAEKIEDIKGWLTAGWEWLVNIAGSAWSWLTETTWTEKVEDIRNWLSNAWSWVLDLGGTAWAWIDENLPWLADAIEWLWDKISAAWQWTITKAGDAWDWFKDSALVQWLDDLKQKITDSKAWQWTIDVALPAVIEGGKAVITAVVEAGGRMYDAIKQGLETGDWSDFWSVTSDVWNAGVAVALSLQLVSGAASWILTAIGSIFGNSAGKLGIGGIPLAIGLLTVGIQLLEAQAEGSYEAFVKNVLVAALVGAIGGAVFGPNGALMGFNLTLSFKLGEKIEGWADAWSEFLGIPPEHTKLLEEYEQYRQALIDEATKDMNWLQKLWWQLTGNQPEGLLSFPEWKEAMGYTTDDFEKVTDAAGETVEAIEETADDVERLTGELSKLDKQALIVAETLRQGGTLEQALALLGIAYWET